jgi:hypothetical protein
MKSFSEDPKPSFVAENLSEAFRRINDEKPGKIAPASGGHG